MQIGDRIEVLRDDGLPARVIFDQVPPKIFARGRPCRSRSTATRGGSRPVDADLSDTRASAGRPTMSRCSTRPTGKMDVQGWVTLTNNSGTPLHQRRHLAGRGRRSGDRAAASDGDYRYRHRPAAARCARRGHGDRQPRAARRFLPLSAARADDDRRQADQAGQLPRRARYAGGRAPMSSQRLAATAEQPVSVNTVLRFSSSRDRGSAMRCRRARSGSTSATRAGNPQFIGESAIGHTPMGSRTRPRHRPGIRRQGPARWSRSATR